MYIISTNYLYSNNVRTYLMHLEDFILSKFFFDRKDNKIKISNEKGIKETLNEICLL